MSWISQRNPHSHLLFFSFFLHPSFPLVSSLEPSHAPAILRSSAARVWKNKLSDWRNDKQWAEGGSVSVSAAASWPFAAVVERATFGTHVHTLRKYSNLSASLPEMVRMWRDGIKALGGPHACSAIHHSVYASHTLMPTNTVSTHRHTVVLHTHDLAHSRWHTDAKVGGGQCHGCVRQLLMQTEAELTQRKCRVKPSRVRSSASCCPTVSPHDCASAQKTRWDAECCEDREQLTRVFSRKTKALHFYVILLLKVTIMHKLLGDSSWNYKIEKAMQITCFFLWSCKFSNAFWSEHT